MEAWSLALRLMLWIFQVFGPGWPTQNLTQDKLKMVRMVWKSIRVQNWKLLVPMHGLRSGSMEGIGGRYSVLEDLVGVSLHVSIPLLFDMSLLINKALRMSMLWFSMSIFLIMMTGLTNQSSRYVPPTMSIQCPNKSISTTYHPSAYDFDDPTNYLALETAFGEWYHSDFVLCLGIKSHDPDLLRSIVAIHIIEYHW